MNTLKKQLETRPKPFHTQRAPYIVADQALVNAAEISIMLGQPLVLAGEPGVGKTGFAYKLAEDTGLFMHPEITVSTTTEGRSLLYSFDEVKRFQQGQQSETPDKLVRLVRFTGFGRAILWAAGPKAKVRVNPALDPSDVSETKPDERGYYELGALFPEEFRQGDGTELTKPTASLVLLDEFDKAPRDAPNDLLRAVERMTFTIDELGLEIGVHDDHADDAWPMLVLTSNSERSLPDAFLRRCVFHWISFPPRGSDTLERIVASHCAHYRNTGSGGGGAGGAQGPDDWLNGNFVHSVVELLHEMRDLSVNKKPGTGELLAFVSILLNRGKGPFDTVSRADPDVMTALGSLLKTQQDLTRASA